MGDFDGELSELLRKSVIILDGSLDEFESDSCYGSYDKDLENCNNVNETRNILDDQKHDTYENSFVDNGHIGGFRFKGNLKNETATSQNACDSWNASDNFIPSNVISKTRFNSWNGCKAVPDFEMTRGFQPNVRKDKMNVPIRYSPQIGICHEPQIDSCTMYHDGLKLRCDSNIFQVSYKAMFGISYSDI